MSSLLPIIQAREVHKWFEMGSHRVHALKGVDIAIEPGDFLALSGSSGSGKTTLLNLMGCIDCPDEGSISFEGTDVRGFSKDGLSKFRREKIGFIFQTFNLIPVLTAFENVEYPLLLLNVAPSERRARSLAALERVGLARFEGHRPAQLSGGQRQRVAIARALVKNPRLILADEPTANLDAKTANDILDLMQRLNAEEAATFVFSSHDPGVLSRAGKIAKLVDGVLCV